MYKFILYNDFSVRSFNLHISISPEVYIYANGYCFTQSGGYFTICAKFDIDISFCTNSQVVYYNHHTRPIVPYLYHMSGHLSNLNCMRYMHISNNTVFVLCIFIYGCFIYYRTIIGQPINILCILSTIEDLSHAGPTVLPSDSIEHFENVTLRIQRPTYVCIIPLWPYHLINVFQHNIPELLPQDYVCSPPEVDDFYLYASMNTNNNSSNSNLETLVVNLSSHKLSDDEIKVLKRGLKFCPTPGEPNFGDLRDDLNKFHTRLRRQLFFSTLPEKDEEDGRPSIPSQDDDRDGFSHQKFREPSKWKPPPVVQLELFFRQNEMDLLTHNVPSYRHHNLSKGEQAAIKSLSNNRSIVIKPADKGGAVVVQDVLDYISEGMRQLSDPKFYIETPEDLTNTHTCDINTFLKKLLDDDQIDDKCYEYLYVSKERTSLFYMLPKIHKNPKKPPGRPIVSGNGCPTERISQFVDFFLQPTVKLLPSYVQDTTHFLKKLLRLDRLPPDSLIVTIDVSSLYTNIPNAQGIEAAKLALLASGQHNRKPSIMNLCTLLEKVLTMNNFSFAGRQFLQVGGTAMGTKVAPSFANTFMGWFEDQFVYTYPKQPLLWVRYIDDIFQIWTHGMIEFRKFEQHLNNAVESIKFETDISNKEVHFLDVTVKIEDGLISTSLYTKPTDAHNYLSYKSCHPRNCKKAIPYSQFLRVRRICSNTDDFVFHSRNLARYFLKADYPADLIQESFDKAFQKDRHILIHPPLKDRTVDKEFPEEIFLISTYHPAGGFLNDIIRKNWDLLDRSSSTRPILNWKITKGFRRPKNLRDHLVRALCINPMDVQQDRRSNNLKKGKPKKRCSRPNCRYCPKLVKKGSINSPITGRKYNTIRNCDCETNNIIYCISCTRCHKQYVGHTKRTLRERMCEHFRFISQNNNTHSVGRHFNTEDHRGLSDVEIFVLQFGRKDPDSAESLAIRLILELMWIHRLRSTTPMGLNVFD